MSRRPWRILFWRQNDKGQEEYRFKPRRLSGYVLKFGMLIVLIGVLASLIVLLTQYTKLNPSTYNDEIYLVSGNTDYLLACTLCNVFGILTLIAYYFMIARQYRPYQAVIAKGRMFHILIAMGIASLSIVVSFVMMGWTYTTWALNRNTIAIVFTVVVAIINLAAVGYEQWAVFRIEQDILKSRSGSDDGDKASKDKNHSASPSQETGPVGPIIDDKRASADPDDAKK